MALTRPVTKTVISATDFGQPVYDWITARTPESWSNVTFINGWSNYETGSYDSCQFRKVGDMVNIRGFIKGGTSNSVVFTLPVGYRPLKNISFPISGPPLNINAFTPSISVQFNGNVAIYDVASGPVSVALGFIQYPIT